MRDLARHLPIMQISAAKPGTGEVNGPPHTFAAGAISGIMVSSVAARGRSFRIAGTPLERDCKQSRQGGP